MNSLVLIPTPLGHPDDITVRARTALAEVDELYAEDTRVTLGLLRGYGISRSVRSCHDHNESQRTIEIVSHLQAGRSVGLVSDAGTPLISDPGFTVVRAVRDAGFTVTALPGACAAITALIGSGLPADRFYFAGFLPADSADLRGRLAELAAVDATLVCYESPKRLGATLDLMAAVWPTREVVVARNLTKTYEQWLRGTSTEVRAALGSEDRGEVVLLIGRGGEFRESPDARIVALLSDGMDPRRIRDVVAAETGLPRREIYARVLALKP